MLSYINQCRNIGVSLTNGTISYRSFSCVLPSFKETVEAMQSPLPSQWQLSSEFKKNRFLESIQGVTHDGRYWYISANGNGTRKGQGIYKYDQRMNLIKMLDLSSKSDLIHIPSLNHIGDLECYENKLYVPVQGPNGFLIVSTDLSESSMEWFQTDAIGDSHPWCAINRWNKNLYTSDFTGQIISKKVSDYELKLYAYDLDTMARNENSDIELQVPTLRVQGGCFTSDGYLFLSSDAYTYNDILLKIGAKITTPQNKAKYLAILAELNETSIPLKPCITAYSIINGHYFGSISIQREKGATFHQEVEGLTYWPKNESGKSTKLHVIMLENQLNTDGVYFKHFQSPIN